MPASSLNPGLELTHLQTQSTRGQHEYFSMSDLPKKPGSLRDRIAAFENKAPASTAPPPPRPKPGNLQWKPKVPSPPSSPPASSTGDGLSLAEKKFAAGMSASDAKETIGAGGSLKERMAALQGRGGFGGMSGAVSPPPKPASEKPKWKPPPVVQVVDPDEPDKPSAPATPAAADSAPDVGSEPHTESTEHAQPAEDEGKPAEEDPEEEERQRRAAIAARMARLGGARVGMAPPIFGKKPDIKKEIKKEEVEAASAEPSAEGNILQLN